MRHLLIVLLLGALPLQAQSLRELQWAELIPAGAAPAPPPTPIHQLSQLADVLAVETGPAATQLSPAAPVVRALDGQRVKLPGYIVPLDMSEEGRVTEFLLVPYFGACIHVPPPPSNQIVHATSELGVRVDELYQPFWIEGPLKVEHASSELAEAGYRMQAEKIYLYELADIECTLLAQPQPTAVIDSYSHLYWQPFFLAEWACRDRLAAAPAGQFPAPLRRAARADRAAFR